MYNVFLLCLNVSFCSVIVSQTDKPNGSRWSSHCSIKMINNKITALTLRRWRSAASSVNESPEKHSASQERLLSSACGLKPPTSVGKSSKTRLQLETELCGPSLVLLFCRAGSVSCVSSSFRGHISSAARPETRRDGEQEEERRKEGFIISEEKGLGNYFLK